MDTEQLKGKLTEAGVSEDGIAKLEAERMLDVELLAETSENDLREVGLLMGDAKRVKRAFPAAAAPPAVPAQPAPAAPATPSLITVVMKGNEPDSDETVLNGVRDKNEDAIDEARNRWGTRAVYVLTEQGELDVPATVAAIKFFNKHGDRDRIANSANQHVKVVSLDMVVNSEEDFNPLTGQVLVPGEPMSQLTPDQRLLIAFGVEQGVVSHYDDEDAVIDTVSRMTPKWKLVESDLAGARAADHEQYHLARRRVRGKVTPADSGGFLLLDGGRGSHHEDRIRREDFCGAPDPAPSRRVPAGTHDVLKIDQLTGPQGQQLCDALLSCFPTRAGFTQFVAGLGVSLEQITSGQGYGYDVYEAVMYFKSQSRLWELISAARRERMHDPKLMAFMASWPR